MSPVALGSIVFAGVSGGGLLGLSVRKLLPPEHLHDESVGMVKFGTGLLATLTALVLGLLVASAKGNYDRAIDEVTQTAARVMLLDRTLAQYGPQTQEARGLLREITSSLVDVLNSSAGIAAIDTPARLARGEKFQTKLRELTPENDTQRALRARAVEIAGEMAQARVLAIAQGEASIPTVFLVMLVLWLAAMYTGFGLVSVRNLTVLVTLFLCALSMGGTVFLIESMNHPIEGVMKVSSAPLSNALAHLGQ